jgi:DNA-binding transcriptional ArsR family regulator
MVQLSKRGVRGAGLAEALPPDLFKALCDPSRLAVLTELAACKPPCTVGRIAECCPTDMSVVSRHLATLRAAGVVEAHRSGKEVHYELSTSALAGSPHEDKSKGRHDHSGQDSQKRVQDIQQGRSR